MNVRIIAGKYGGRKIAAPGRRSTHAMSERIRNALFNSIAAQIPGATVLDAFAGSGSIGIEALSRGAIRTIFIEQDHSAAKIIQNNLDLLGVGEDSQVISRTVHNWLSNAEPQLFDIVFADPPYHDTQLNTVLRLINLITDDGLMIISLPSDQELPATKGVDIIDERIYGNAKIITVKKR